MPILMAQYTVTTATVPIFQIPPGPFNATMYNLSASATIYLGTSTNITTKNALVMHSVPTSFQGLITSTGAQVYGFASTACTLNLLMITDS